MAMPEAVVSLGDRIPTLPRSLPRSAAGVSAVEAAASIADAMLISGNGVLTSGSDLSQALLRMELVEHLARILSIARTLGSLTPLSATEMAALLEARKKAGLGPPSKM
jgi:L-fuculose-phosphate aldolase